MFKQMAFRGVKVVVAFEKCVPAPNHPPFDRVRGADHYTISPSLLHFMKILNLNFPNPKLANDSRALSPLSLVIRVIRVYISL